MICNICGKDSEKSWNRCEEHYKCDDCSSREGLCTYTEGVLCATCHKKRVEKRIIKFKGDHKYTPVIICPYCGYLIQDSWDLSDDSDTIECEDCGNEYRYKRIITVEYSTYKYKEHHE